jgi:RES domain-containing protein
LPEKIERILKKISFEQFNAIVFRNVVKDLDALSITGSFHSGGRWNLKESFGAIYSSLKKEVAVAELERSVSRRGLTLADLGPREMVRLKVTLNKVLNLTDPAILKAISLNTPELTEDGWKKTQKLAKSIWNAKFEGILVPSAAASGVNLVIYPGNKQQGSTIIEQDRTILRLK